MHAGRRAHISRFSTGARRKHWSRQSIAPAGDDQSRRFRVIHPYHPLFGQDFELLLRAQNWREDRVWFHDAVDRLRSLPANWTSTVAEDPFTVVAAGRAAFRVEELLELVRLIGEWKP
jgi:hypothetical protein